MVALKKLTMWISRRNPGCGGYRGKKLFTLLGGVLSRGKDGGERRRVSTSFITDIIIFVSSYFPLFLILFVKDVKSGLVWCTNQISISPYVYLSHPWWSLGMLGISSLCLMLLIFLRRYLFSSDRGGTSVVLVSCKRVRGDMLNFTIPFLVGLIGFNYDTWQQTAAFLIFMFFMFLFLRKDESIMLNPMFLLLNLKLYRVEFQRTGCDRKDMVDVLSIGDMVLSDAVVNIKKVRGVSFVLEKSQTKID